jgi:hypothetical protein
VLAHSHKLIVHQGSLILYRYPARKNEDVQAPLVPSHGARTFRQERGTVPSALINALCSIPHGSHYGASTHPHSGWRSGIDIAAATCRLDAVSAGRCPKNAAAAPFEAITATHQFANPRNHGAPGGPAIASLLANDEQQEVAMEIAIRARHAGSNEELRQQIERSIQFAAGRHRSRIRRISVYLTDLNGPRGGADKLCQMTADIRGAQPVLILERGDDLLGVINRAARRLGYRIGRRTHRQRAPHQREYRSTIRAA